MHSARQDCENFSKNSSNQNLLPAPAPAVEDAAPVIRGIVVAGYHQDSPRIRTQIRTQSVSRQSETENVPLDQCSKFCEWLDSTGDVVLSLQTYGIDWHASKAAGMEHTFDGTFRCRIYDAKIDRRANTIVVNDEFCEQYVVTFNKYGLPETVTKNYVTSELNGTTIGEKIMPVEQREFLYDSQKRLLQERTFRIDNEGLSRVLINASQVKTIGDQRIKINYGRLPRTSVLLVQSCQIDGQGVAIHNANSEALAFPNDPRVLEWLALRSSVVPVRQADNPNRVFYIPSYMTETDVYTDIVPTTLFTQPTPLPQQERHTAEYIALLHQYAERNPALVDMLVRQGYLIRSSAGAVVMAGFPSFIKS